MDPFRSGLASGNTAHKQAGEMARTSSRRLATHQKKALVDLVILVVGTAAVFVVAGRHEWFGTLSNWVQASDFRQLDETLLAALFLLFGLMVFAFRRWRDSLSEVKRRQRAQVELELLYGELGERVEQRTSQLSSAIQALNAEVAERKRVQELALASEARYRQLFDASPLPMWVYDLQTLAFLAVNDAAVEHYGHSREKFLASTISDIRPEQDLPALRESLKVIGRNIDHSGVWQHRKADGTLIDVEITSHVIDFEGRPAKLVLANDVTLRRQQEHRIARLSRIRAVLGGVSSAMLRLQNRDELLQEVCRVCSVEGVFPMAWVVSFDAHTRAPSVSAFHGDDPQSADLIKAAFDKVARTELPSYRASRTAKPVYVNDTISDAALAPMRDELVTRGFLACAALPLIVDAVVDSVLVLLARERDFFDEEERALLEWLSADISYALTHIEKSQRLEHLSYYDALTGLANAHLFRDRLDQFVFAAQHSRSSVCVMVIDLAHFTRINDSFGRAVGDRLLREVGERLHGCLFEPYALGRIGADTFAAASPRADSKASNKLRDAVFAAFKQPFEIEGHEIQLGAQAGIALFPNDGADASTVFKNAEVALKSAKSSGEQYVYYSSDMQERIARRLALEEELRAAVDANQFVLHYQARIDMISGELVAAEALLRWQHPQRGLIAPGEFIALAEETGLIVSIGAWAIRQVCAQQAAWIAAGLAVVPIAVNVSSIQFEKGDLVQTVRDALAAHSLGPRYLELELTESAVMADPEAAARVLKTLHKLGVSLALDDFGTGYSSLAHLKRFPFHSVKIDQSFVVNIVSNPEDAAIASAIIAMAHRLGLKVVAEGVETQGQFNFLRREGCDGMQGFHFSGAVAAELFETQLVSGRHMALPAQPAEEQRTLLLVDDEPGIRSALKRTLRRDGYHILTASNGPEALQLLAENPVQVIVSDQRMPEMSGTEFLNIVRQLYPDTLRIILSGYTDLGVVTDSVNRGSVFRFLTKPWDDELLREQVRDAFRRYRPGSTLH